MPSQLETTSARRTLLGRWSFPVLVILSVLAAHGLIRLLTTTAIPGSGVVRPLLVSVVSPRAGYAVDPWPWQLLAGAAVTAGLTAAALGLAVLLSVRERPWWPRFLLLWASAVLAGVVAAGAAQVGDILHVIELFGGRGGSTLRTFTLPALAEAVRWGLVWGAVPALATALLATPRPPRGQRRAWRVWVIFLLAVAAGVGLAAIARGAAVSTMTEVAAPSVAPTPEPTNTPAAVAPSAAPAFEGRCDAGSLTTTFEYVDAASGRRFGVATVTNVGTEACAVVGLPDLAFGAADRTSVVPVIEPWGGMTGGGLPGDGVIEGVEEALVMLEPGGSATSDLTWRGTAAGAVTAETVHIAPWAGATRTIVAEPIDLEDGSVVGVSPWMPAP